MQCGTFEAVSANARTIPADYNRQSTLTHLSIAAAFGADTNNIYVAVLGATPDGGIGEDKYILQSGKSIVIGPGINKISIKSAAGAPLVGVQYGPVFEVVK